MRQIIKDTLKRLFAWLIAFHSLILRKKSYIHSSGWMESLKRGYPCRKNGSEIPWMNYTIISILEKRLRNNLVLFEYGSGYSTIFYARLVKEVISVESERYWYNNIRKRVPNNAKIYFKEYDIDGDYCRSVGQYSRRYDVVIVDGRDRVNCVKQSIENLSEEGVILLDDSHRGRYIEAISYAESKGFNGLELEGLKPTGFRVNKITILYRRNNCLNI